MRYSKTGFALAAVVLAACSPNPKSTVIPTDPDRWKDLKPQVQQLDENDRKLVALYLLRVVMRSKLANEPIPADVTLGEAIDDEKKFLEKNPMPQ